MNARNLPQSSPSAILVITIDFGNGEYDTIAVHSDDEPSTLAEDFCNKHGFNSNIRRVLEGQIEEEIEKLLAPLPTTKASNRMGEINSRLYYDSVKNKESSMSKLQEDKANEESKRISEITFKPQINNHPVHKKPWGEIIKQKNERLEAIRKEQAEKEVSECTFKPELISKKYKQDTQDRFVKLYNNARERSNKLTHKSVQVLKTQCTFSPSINRTTPKKRENRPATSQRTQKEEEFLFKPKVGRPPKHRDLKGKDIGSRLHAISFKQKKHEKRPSPVKATNEKSEEYFRSLKARKCREIFDDLNPINGVISQETIKAAKIQPYLQEILDPLLADIEELDFYSFSDCIEALLKILTPDQRSDLLMKRKESSVPPNYTVKQGKFAGDSVYYRNTSKKRAVKQKIDNQRLQSASMVMRDCTFKPKIKNLPKSTVSSKS